MSKTLTYSPHIEKGIVSANSNPEDCKTYPLLSNCKQSQNHKKVLTRHVWEESKERVRMNRLSEEGKAIYRSEGLKLSEALWI